jgi:hypothetical protein
MKKNLLAALATTMVAGSAMAAGAFDGPNVQLGLGMGTQSSQITSSGTQANTDGTGNTSGSSSSISSSANFLGTVSAGYSYGFSNKFNLAGNVFYMFGSSDAGKSSGNQSYSDGTSYSYNNKVTMKDTFGVVLEPGYYFADKTLGFLKVGWTQTKLGLTSADYCSDCNPTSTGFTSSANIQGTLYGLGMKQMITNNVYVGVEAYQIQYANKSFSNRTTDAYGNVSSGSTAFKPLTSYAGLTLGYKF